MNQIKSSINVNSDEYKKNQAHMQTLIDDLQAKAEKIALGGNETAREKHTSRGKLLVRDRINALLDPNSPFLELS